MATAPDPVVDFRTHPSRYKHWRLDVDGAAATLTLDVNESAGLFPGCELKLNSYDLGVDIELADAVQRLRFEHPQVRAVVLRSGKERVFSAGANIRMLASASHRHKVNFCKFTNETRNAMEDASAFSSQTYVALINGTAAGGGYELALAADHIMLVDDGSAAVSMPELPLLAVLPATGGLTRLVDKRGVRRDLADVFCTTEEGVKGARAVEWKLVDQLVPRSQMEACIAERVKAAVRAGTGLTPASGVPLSEIERRETSDELSYSTVVVRLDRSKRTANVTIAGPVECLATIGALLAQGSAGWPLRCARELDDAILHLRFNEPDISTIVFRTSGDPNVVLAHDQLLVENHEHWFAREVLLLWKRVLKRIDLTSKSLVALIEPGSCFAGTLAELAFAADRSYILIATEEAPTLTLSPANFGSYQMSNGLTRLQTRFLNSPGQLAAAGGAVGKALSAEDANGLGLVTVALDDIDWEDEVRIFLEERASFSPDALTAMEANLRFPGPETMETKIFARLSAWQNWIFQRPNAAGPEGALARYGTGLKPSFDSSRV
jgi:benzoyl-CoA-dihydrodiol lyase